MSCATLASCNASLFARPRACRVGPRSDSSLTEGLTLLATVVAYGNKLHPEHEGISQMDAPRNAYSLALEHEDRTWQILHGMPRSDPRYPQALSDWQAAADRIGLEAEKLLKRHPKPRFVSLETAAPALPPASRPHTASLPKSGRSAFRGPDR